MLSLCSVRTVKAQVAGLDGWEVCEVSVLVFGVYDPSVNMWIVVAEFGSGRVGVHSSASCVCSWSCSGWSVHRSLWNGSRMGSSVWNSSNGEVVSVTRSLFACWLWWCCVMYVTVLVGFRVTLLGVLLLEVREKLVCRPVIDADFRGGLGQASDLHQ